MMEVPISYSKFPLARYTHSHIYLAEQRSGYQLQPPASGTAGRSPVARCAQGSSTKPPPRVLEGQVVANIKIVSFRGVTEGNRGQEED